jgi:hypothetical protein
MFKTNSKILIFVLITSLLFSIFISWNQQNRINKNVRYELRLTVDGFLSWKRSVSDDEKDTYRSVILYHLSKASGFLRLSSYKKDYPTLAIEGLVQCMIIPEYRDKLFGKPEEIIEYLQAISKNPSDIEPSLKLNEIIASIQGVPMYIPK